MNDIIWNYASNLSSTNSIVKSYAKYLRSGVEKAKEMLNCFSLALQGDMTKEEVNDMFSDEVYYFKTCLVLKSVLINSCVDAVADVEENGEIDQSSYESIVVSIPTIDNITLTVTLEEVKTTLVSALDAVYFSSVLFSSADPLTNDNLSVNEKIMAKSQLCSEAISQIPNADSNKISSIQAFIDSIADTTYDSNTILSTLCSFCGFNTLGSLSKENINDFLLDVPVVGLDQYTGETPFNGFINTVTDKLADFNVVDVLDFSAGLIFPAYGVFKFIRSAAKFAPKVLNLVGDFITDIGSNIILSVTNTTMDPIDFNLDGSDRYSLCSEGFNFNSGEPKSDFLSGEPKSYSILDLQYDYSKTNPITFETIFGNVSFGYSRTYEATLGVTRLKPFNFIGASDIINMGFDELTDINYSMLQVLLAAVKPKDDMIYSENYQLRNQLYNGMLLSSICLPIAYLPIYYYLQILDRLKSYDTSTTEGARFFSQLYRALFIREWDGNIYPVNIGDIDDGVAMEMIQGLGKLIYYCTIFLLKAIKSAATGSKFIFPVSVPLHNYELRFDFDVQFKAYNDVPFTNTDAIKVAMSTPRVERSGSDPTVVRISYKTNDSSYTAFSDNYNIGQGWSNGSTVYDIFLPISSFILGDDNLVKPSCYIPYIRGTGSKPTFHIATDKENLENLQHVIMIAALSIAAVIVVTSAIKLGVRFRRSFQQTQALIQSKRSLLGTAIMNNDSVGVNQYTKDLLRLQKKAKFLNVLGAGSLASTSEVMFNNNNAEVVDSVCDYVNSKIGA